MVSQRKKSGAHVRLPQSINRVKTTRLLYSKPRSLFITAVIINQAQLFAMTKSSSILSLSNVSKHYKNGFTALKHIDLTIHRGEIFALLGPNGAGKTTLINSICGLVNLSGGQITIDGFDHQSQYKQARALVGL